MKNKIYTLLFAAGIVSAASCVKLDTAPYDKVTDLTYWSEDKGAALATLNSCYGSMYSFSEIMASEGATDNAYVKGLNTTQPVANGSYGTDNGYVKSIWDHYYTSIRICNELLTNIDKVPELAPELKARYIAECLTLRSLFYYELYTRFGNIPYFEKPLSVEESETISRTDRATVLSNVIRDLNAAINSNALPASYSEGDRGRITLGAAKAVLAKVYLFEGDFAKVKEITDDIMTTGPYKLFDSYSGLFEIENEYNSEVILDIQYSPSLREFSMREGEAGFLPPSMGGYCNIAPTQELVDSYIMLNGKSIKDAGSEYNESKPYENRDPRLAATIVYTGNSYKMADGSDNVIDCTSPDSRDAFGTTSDVTPTGYYLKKWWDNKYRLTLMSGLNVIVIRYADILLMNAEAAVELNQMDETVWNNTIRPIRQRAGFTDAGALDFNPQADLRSVVRNERRCELAFEGARFKDIIRWKIADKVLNGNVHGVYTGETVNTDNGYAILEKRSFDPGKHYLWPIPQKDRDLNKNLDQNPNW